MIRNINIGFSLIQLMTTLAIIGALSGAAHFIF
ncbi:MAG: Tfp pilus assembly protein PilE [Pseudohongiellaceae bacterium]